MRLDIFVLCSCFQIKGKSDHLPKDLTSVFPGAIMDAVIALPRRIIPGVPILIILIIPGVLIPCAHTNEQMAWCNGGRREALAVQNKHRHCE